MVGGNSKACCGCACVSYACESKKGGRWIECAMSVPSVIPWRINRPFLCIIVTGAKGGNLGK